MVEKKNSEKTLQEILSDALAQDLIDDPPTSMSFEEFEEMLDRHESDRKRKHRRRLALAAATFLIFIVGAALVFNTLTTDVGANKNAPEEIVTEDGVVIEDEGWGSSGEDSWVITNWDEVASIKIAEPDLIIPEYIPKEYTFSELRFEQIESWNKTYEYLFISEKGDTLEIEINIQMGHIAALNIHNISRELLCDVGTIYIQDGEIKRATTQIDDGFLVRIWSELSDEEIVYIIENLSL